MAEKKVFIISDTHFAHTRIIQYENRPFNSVKEMDKEIIKISDLANRIIFNHATII